MNFYLILFALILSGCSTVQNTAEHDHGYRWYNYSAEYEALCYQSFNLAKLHLQQRKIEPRTSAIVVDIDDTLLKNEPYAQAFTGQKNKKARDWVDIFGKSIKNAYISVIPGALEFLRDADKLGVTIFYVTNRLSEHQDVTIRQLNKAEFPQVTNNNLLMRAPTEKNKVDRFQIIQKRGYSIKLYIGDSLADLSAQASGLSQEQQKAWVHNNRDYLNTYAVLLPNPIYGYWYWSSLKHK